MKMNDRVTLLRRMAGRDAAGQAYENWVPRFDTWANVKFESGAQVLRSNADVSITRVSIRIRTRPDIDATHRVRYKGTDYDVKALLPDSADRAFMFLVCEAVK
jgi:SPP1 family predicted phage head-tail adaptor